MRINYLLIFISTSLCCMINEIDLVVDVFKESGNGADNSKQLEEAGSLCRSTLDTLCVYVDWIAMSHILERDSLLLQMLCTMLRYDHIQLPAAECLLIITNRKVGTFLLLPL